MSSLLPWGTAKQQQGVSAWFSAALCVWLMPPWAIRGFAQALALRSRYKLGLEATLCVWRMVGILSPTGKRRGWKSHLSFSLLYKVLEEQSKHPAVPQHAAVGML